MAFTVWGRLQEETIENGVYCVGKATEGVQRRVAQLHSSILVIITRFGAGFMGVSVVIMLPMLHMFPIDQEHGE